MWLIKTPLKDFLQLKNQLILFYLDTLNQLNSHDSASNKFAFKMPTPLLIDGHQQYCTVMMESNKVTLQLRNSTFNIGVDVPIEQTSVDGLVHLITVFKLCEGWESLAYESTTEHVHVNDTSFLDSEKKRKTFSKSCNSILNWSSTTYAV